jgi:hypothetical protein
VLKWVGAAYLVYVGVAMLHAPPVAPLLSGLAGGGLSTAPTATSLRKVFAQGFWTNTLNPKVALFFLAFPAAVHPSAPCAAQDPDLPVAGPGVHRQRPVGQPGLGVGGGLAGQSRRCGQRSPLHLA